MTGHRYTKVIVASIVAGVGIFALFYALSNGTMAFSNVLSAQSRPKEPIAIYEHCVENPIRATKERIDVDCYKTQIPSDAAFDMQGRGTGGLLKSFSFDRPSQLWGNYGGGEMKVYQYGQNDFDLGLNDQVSEKKYHTTLWELPT